MSLQIQIEGDAPRDVALTRRDGDHAARLQIDGRVHAATLQSRRLTVDGVTERVWVAVDHDVVYVHAFGQAWRLEVTDPAQRIGAGVDEADVYHAPMPGTVITAAVAPGTTVAAGDPLLIIESMKMQSEIIAWRDGIVQRTPLAVGDTFDRGAVLVELEPAVPAA